MKKHQELIIAIIEFVLLFVVMFFKNSAKGATPLFAILQIVVIADGFDHLHEHFSKGGDKYKYRNSYFTFSEILILCVLLLSGILHVKFEKILVGIILLVCVILMHFAIRFFRWRKDKKGTYWKTVKGF